MESIPLSYLWYFLAIITLLGAITVITVKNPIYSILFLVFTFFCISAHYVLLNAQFLMAVNIIVYAGAIMVLFLFVIMMLDLRRIVPQSKGALTKLGASVLGGLFLLAIIKLLSFQSQVSTISVFDDRVGLVQELGLSLYKNYLLPFELITVLFFVALIGAIYLGKKETGDRSL